MSEIKIGDDKHAVEASAHEMSAAPSDGVKRRRRLKKPRRPPVFDTVEAAAAKLSLDPTALRARLRRAQRAEGDSIVAELGGGIRAFKLGKSWRVRFPEP